MVTTRQRRTLTSLSLSLLLALSSASMLVSILESRVSRRRYQNVCIALSGHVIRVSTCVAQSLRVDSYHELVTSSARVLTLALTTSRAQVRVPSAWLPRQGDKCRTGHRFNVF